jgi:hypothetical protein
LWLRGVAPPVIVPRFVELFALPTSSTFRFDFTPVVCCVPSPAGVLVRRLDAARLVELPAVSSSLVALRFARPRVVCWRVASPDDARELDAARFAEVFCRVASHDGAMAGEPDVARFVEPRLPCSSPPGCALRPAACWSNFLPLDFLLLLGVDAFCAIDLTLLRLTSPSLGGREPLASPESSRAPVPALDHGSASM